MTEQEKTHLLNLLKELGEATERLGQLISKVDSKNNQMLLTYWRDNGNGTRSN